MQKIGLKLCDDWRNTQKGEFTHCFMVVERLWVDHEFPSFGFGNGGADFVFSRTIVLDEPRR